MTTNDSNGLLLFNSSDSLTPLSTNLNAMTNSISGAFNANTRIWPVANTAGRSAKVTEIGVANISVNKPLFVWRADAPTGQNLEVTFNGTTWDYYSSAADDTGWVDCSITATNWTNVATEPVQIRRIGKNVYMRGSAHNSTFAKDTLAVIGTVPTGFRPSQRVGFSASMNSSANLFIRIETNGNITVGWYTTASTTATGSWYGFSNVSYLLG